MSVWYCPKCRMTFRIGGPTSGSQAERLGCPECRLWFFAGKIRKRHDRTTVYVMPADLAKHKAAA